MRLHPDAEAKYRMMREHEERLAELAEQTRIAELSMGNRHQRRAMKKVKGLGQ